MSIGIQLMAARPPFVRFELSEIEDRNATIAEGRYIAKSVVYAHITPPGSKDVVIRDAGEWLSDITRKARMTPEPTYPPEWADRFNAQFRAWQDGNELPPNGTPIRSWPVVTPAQVKRLVDVRCLTVEDLAAANEDLLRQIGMGARDLQSKARTFLEAGDTGKVAAKVADLEVKLLEALRVNEELRGANRVLNGRLDSAEGALDAIRGERRAPMPEAVQVPTFTLLDDVGGQDDDVIK